MAQQARGHRRSDPRVGLLAGRDLGGQLARLRRGRVGEGGRGLVDDGLDLLGVGGVLGGGGQGEEQQCQQEEKQSRLAPLPQGGRWSTGHHSCERRGRMNSSANFSVHGRCFQVS
jgi:hypothetical protein